jgi:hypothetical protein
MVEEFAYAIEYLVRMVGADTPVHLHGIARALCLVNWDLPQPERVTPGHNVFGFTTCLCERACLAHAADNGTPREAQALLEPLPAKSGLLKMCLIHDQARLSRGFRLVAARGNNGVAAYVPNTRISEDEAHALLKEGWRCLFVEV